jgi:16S rRNA (guanine966-N2)-methyltransferase
VRQAIMNVLFSRLPDGFADEVVLDLFAGSGALGIEALSRGARTAVFVENDREALVALRDNAALLRLGTSAVIRAADALRIEPSALGAGPFGLVLADPPYRIDPGAVTGTFARLGAAGALRPECVVVYEHDSKATVTWPEGFSDVDRRTYGSTGVSIATWEGEPSA